MTSEMQAAFWLADVEVEGGGDLVERFPEDVGEGPGECLRALVADGDQIVLGPVFVNVGPEFSDEV